MSGANTVNTKISQAQDAGAFDPTWRIPVARVGSDQAFSTDARKLTLGGQFLPLIGGNVSGIVNFIDDANVIAGGAIQSRRNIALTGHTPDVVNKPFVLNNFWTGTNLDPPAGPYGPQYATSITNTLTDFNTGSLGFRGFVTATFAGPRTIGATLSAVTSSVAQSSPFPPGTNVWIPNHDYAAGQGIHNGLSHYAVMTPGRGPVAFTTVSSVNSSRPSPQAS